MLDLNNIMLGSMNVSAMVDFYKKVFEREPDMEEGGFTGWQVGSTFFTVGEHSEMTGPAKDPARVMFNFATSDVKGEFDRIVKAGAKVIKEPYNFEDAWVATLADPDGNYFQLMTPWEEEK